MRGQEVGGARETNEMSIPIMIMFFHRSFTFSSATRSRNFHRQRVRRQRGQGINGITRWLNETESSRDSDRRDVVVNSKKINSDEEGVDGGGATGAHTKRGPGRQKGQKETDTEK